MSVVGWKLWNRLLLHLINCHRIASLKKFKSLITDDINILQIIVLIYNYDVPLFTVQQVVYLKLLA